MIEPTPIPLDVLQPKTLVEVANDLSREIDTLALDQGNLSPEYHQMVADSFTKLVAQLELTIGKEETKTLVRIPIYL